MIFNKIIENINNKIFIKINKQLLFKNKYVNITISYFEL